MNITLNECSNIIATLCSDFDCVDLDHVDDRYIFQIGENNEVEINIDCCHPEKQLYDALKDEVGDAYSILIHAESLTRTRVDEQNWPPKENTMCRSVSDLLERYDTVIKKREERLRELRMRDFAAERQR